VKLQKNETKYKTILNKKRTFNKVRFKPNQ